MSTLTGLLADLDAEGGDLDRLVAGLDLVGLATPTPAEGWTIAHQLAHLAWTDRQAILAAADPAGFAESLKTANPLSFVEEGAAEGVGEAPESLLGRWRAGRDALRAALAAVPPAEKIPWFGPPMKATSMATARIMETWAHGQDVADALGVRREPTDRLRHIAHLGVRTMGFAFAVRQEPLPDKPVRVELTGPSGDRWEWGPEEAEDRVSGSALEFCLLVVRRRNPADLKLSVTGAVAAKWMSIAQAFAGPPGADREPGRFDD
ncbi:TIGR03084 family metal-binding protein [Crossiella sp. CA-258035]|uniref:TIGR03084 family metal-binding protein n=1 Tax=Crossiella sp. CA-258035 TaxID=2981138 RepID=UPI0024BC245D|nr:TIGR03084 family metal-binding protein [Crossiella sp. CA-258035]WHT17112.1 TIGR03084 family metal-binding protein [Crossiella sp. CA-258035]